MSLWDAHTFVPACRLLADQGRITAVGFSGDGKTLVSAGAKRTIKLWDVASREELIVLHGHRKEIANVGFAENGGLLYSFGYGATCELFLWPSQRQSAK